MVMRGLGAIFYGAAVLFLVMTGLLAGLALTGRLYDCDDGGLICPKGIGALYIGLILLTAAVASFTIGAWVRTLDQAAPSSDNETSA